MRALIRFRWLLFPIVLIIGLNGTAWSNSALPGDPATLGHPGYVIISAGLDSTMGFKWQLGPGPGQRSLTWPHGVLNLPDNLALESLRGVDLAIPCNGSLAGLGHTGQLFFQEGIFEVSEPILLSDGTLYLYLTAGELELLEQRVRYTAPIDESKDPRAGYMFLGGMVLLILILLRRAAMKSRNKS
ncbi:MAG: hypothetical protein KOO60_13700 [Gemmatimonadales bacterium]|nr:hypothetical protein [Gemmatimonadales bacterium]